jgi:branched-chain amino acid transport system permease protein
MAFSRAAKFTLAVLLIAFPWISDSFTAYQLGLYLLYGMVAQGIALCWGRAGFLPLGQALFFGIGAYLSGAALKADLGWALLLPAFAVACLVPALLAGFIGALVFNRQTGSGPYFSLITLALSMLGFQLANSLSGITGGFNGMTGIPGLPGVDTYETLYFVIVGVLTASTLVLAHVMRAPFGQLLIAIRENEERLQFFGFRTSMLKAAAFAISGGVAGLAGVLYAPHQGIVTPQAVGFVLSAELLIWTAVGGRFGLIGPVAGAVLIGFMAAGLRDSFRYWEVAVALVFILVVLKMPGGISGLVSVAMSRFGERREVRGAGIAPSMLAGKEHREAPDLRFDSVGVSMGPVRILNGLSLRLREAAFTASSDQTARARPRRSTCSPDGFRSAAATSAGAGFRSATRDRSLRRATVSAASSRFPRSFPSSACARTSTSRCGRTASGRRKCSRCGPMAGRRKCLANWRRVFPFLSKVTRRRARSRSASGRCLIFR